MDTALLVHLPNLMINHVGSPATAVVVAAPM